MWDFDTYRGHMLEKTSEVDSVPQEKAFLDGKNIYQDSIGLTSFYRCGNTLVRAYLDKITGLYTGSSVRMQNQLNLSLKKNGLAGEGISDKRVWISKDHFPHNIGDTMYHNQRAILIVRNPLDVFPSSFN